MDDNQQEAGSLVASQIRSSLVAGGRVLRGIAEIGLAFTASLRPHKIIESAGVRRLTIVHFGNYVEAYWRFANGGKEDYYGQKYTVDFWASLAARPDIETLTSICLSLDLPNVKLPNSVRAVGVELYPKGRLPRTREVVDAIQENNPTHLIVMTPSIPLIRWGIAANIPTLPMLADSFQARGVMARVHSRSLALVLNHRSIELVANHNVAASLDLKRIGVDPSKIVPFDWPALLSPNAYEAKKAPPADRPFRLIYVGTLLEAKGVGDAIRATSVLRRRGRQVQLTIIGRGDSESFEKLSIAEQIQTHVSFLGSKSHTEVLAAMRDHDAVLVPSHWSYPEGLPMTLYEALCTRTPLLASDHPMFALKIRNRENAIVFPQRNPQALADCIDELASSPALYVKLSEAGAKAAEDYLCPVKYDRLISAFLYPNERGQLLEYSLNRFPYVRSTVA